MCSSKDSTYTHTPTLTGGHDCAGTVAAAAVAPMFERVIILERDDIDINAASLSRPQAELNDMALVCSSSLSAFPACMTNKYMVEQSCLNTGSTSRQRIENTSPKLSQPAEGQLRPKTNGVSEVGCAEEAS